MQMIDGRIAEVGDTDFSVRPDGKLNVWRYLWLFPEDTLARWVLVGVVRKRRIDQ